MPIKEGGRQTEFKQEHCSQVLAGGNKYICGINLFWQNWTWFANPRTPVNPGQVKEIQRFSLDPMKPPSELSFTTVIALDNYHTDVCDLKGALSRLSPPEPAIAFLYSVRDAIQNNADNATLLKWRTLALTATAQFEVVLPGEALYWRSQNIRQEFIETGDVSQLSVRQWIYDVVGFKESKEKDMQKKLSSLAVARMYDEKMRYAKSSERVKDAFVDSAMTVHKRMLSIPAANDVLQWAEENMMETNPFKSIYALQAIIDRAQTPERISWAVRGLLDHWRMEPVVAEPANPFHPLAEISLSG